VKIGCVLLAAGAGKRFGGGKLLHKIDGTPMIARAIELYSSFTFAAQFCVTRTEAQKIQSLAQQNGFAVAINPDPERGVGTSVAIATNAILLQESELDGILYAVSDQPYLRPESVRTLLEAFKTHPNNIVSLCYDGRRGNPAIFPRELFGELTALREDIGGGAVIRQHPELLILIEAGSARELEDIDTLELETQNGQH
jgi:molybdenum cofactor cytidylyltransferase